MASGRTQTKTTQPSKTLGEEEDTFCQKIENGNAHEFPFLSTKAACGYRWEQTDTLTILFIPSCPFNSLPLEQNDWWSVIVIQLFPSFCVYLAVVCFRLPALLPPRKPIPFCLCSFCSLGDLLQVPVSAALSYSWTLCRIPKGLCCHEKRLPQTSATMFCGPHSLQPGHHCSGNFPWCSRSWRCLLLLLGQIVKGLSALLWQLWETWYLAGRDSLVRS